jgi:hypothetical protein
VDFRFAKRLPPFGRRGVDVVEPNRTLQLPRASAGKKHDRNVRVDPLDACAVVG